MKRGRRAVVCFLAMVMAFWSANVDVQAKSVPKISMTSTEQGAYLNTHVTPDKTFMYKDKGNLHVVSVIGMKLTDYTLNKTFGVASQQKIKLPHYNTWGGYFHSNKGGNYVVLGYNNADESTKKTVIKIIKFNRSWKRMGVAEVKGGASNQYTGISEPFASGNVSMTEYKDILYIMTSRMTFRTESGVRHQSNIAFALHTKSMKIDVNNISYSSHSLNQYAKFYGGSLYAVDHGDAYPRGVKITTYDEYGKAESAVSAGARRGSVTAFSFKGNLGNNTTGATVGGLEVSGSYVLVVGSAQPHGSEIDGVTGFAAGFGQNLYLIKRDRNLGNCTVKWLTGYNPQNSGLTVDCPRLVKVNDNAFAILYSVRNIRTGQRTFHCMYMDGTGQVLKDLTFNNIEFRGGTQPVVFNNKIVFVEKPSNLQNAQVYTVPAR